jgi:hypothetical protein
MSLPIPKGDLIPYDMHQGEYITYSLEGKEAS